MLDFGPIGLLLIIANVFFSYKGFKDRTFFETYKLEVEKVLVHKEYKRIITSGFLHVDWPHLIFNMMSLLLFSGAVEGYLGSFSFLLLYFASLVGGEALSLFVHRHNSSYSSVGASGAIGGIIFAAIALFPGMKIGLLFIPIGIPAWIYGLLYVLYSIYGIREKRYNVGHEAHLGGSLTGMLIALLLQPAALRYNTLPILLVALPALGFIVYLIRNPHAQLIGSAGRKKSDYYSVDHKYNATVADQQQEIDNILDKISKKGMDSLSEKEKQILKRYSRSAR